MTVRKIIVGVVLAVAVVASAGREPPAAEWLSLGGQLRDGYFFVEVAVEGQRPLTFLVDTGAAWTVVHTGVAEELGWEIREREEMEYSRLPAAQCGEAELRGRVAFVRDLSPMHDFFPEVDGLLGVDLCKEYVVRMDYLSGSIAVADPSTFMYDGEGEILPVHVSQQMYTQCTMEPAESSDVYGLPATLVDSGSGYVLTVAPRFFPKLWQDPERGVPSRSTTLYGQRRGRMHQLSALRLGSLSLPGAPVNVADSDGDNPAERMPAILGAGALSRFCVIIDAQRFRMILEPGPDSLRPFEDLQRDAMLMWLETEPRLGLRVAATPLTLFDDVDLRQGDLIVAMGDRSDEPLDPDWAEWRLRHMYGQTETLWVEREGEDDLVEVELRRDVAVIQAPKGSKGEVGEPEADGEDGEGEGAGEDGGEGVGGLLQTRGVGGQGEGSPGGIGEPRREGGVEDVRGGAGGEADVGG